MWQSAEWLVGGKTSVVRYSEIPGMSPVGTLIYTHGLFVPMSVEDETANIPEYFASLAQTGWRILRYDARGSGTSQIGDSALSQTWEALGKEINLLKQIIKEKFLTGTSRFILSGLSMGVGSSLQSFCEDNSDVEGLIFILSPTAWDLREAKQSFYQKSAEGMRKEGKEKWLEAFRSRVTANSDPSFLNTDEMLKKLVCSEKKAVEFALEAAGHSDFPPKMLCSTTTDPGHPWSVAQELHEIAQKSGVNAFLHEIVFPSDLLSTNITSLLKKNQ